jgi:hypothetical protein
MRLQAVDEVAELGLGCSIKDTFADMAMIKAYHRCWKGPAKTKAQNDHLKSFKSGIKFELNKAKDNDICKKRETLDGKDLGVGKGDESHIVAAINDSWRGCCTICKLQESRAYKWNIMNGYGCIQLPVTVGILRC